MHTAGPSHMRAQPEAGRTGVVLKLLQRDGPPCGSAKGPSHTQQLLRDGPPYGSAKGHSHIQQLLKDDLPYEAPRGTLTHTSPEGCSSLWQSQGDSHTQRLLRDGPGLKLGVTRQRPEERKSQIQSWGRQSDGRG